MTSASDISIVPGSGALAAGVVGGVVGGIVFGLLMQMGGMMPMVAMLVRSESIVVGWIVHLVIAAFIGIGCGILWWSFGALAAMPAILGMPMFNVNDVALQSLMGHVIYGGVLGLTYGLVRQRVA
ncbi:MAG TPA: hypothetical protein VGA16_05005 [Candidatus Limnocylindria bacterium]